MKVHIVRREGEIYPSILYGLSYYDGYRDEANYHIIPINYIVRLYSYVKFLRYRSLASKLKKERSNCSNCSCSYIYKASRRFLC